MIRLIGRVHPGNGLAAINMARNDDLAEQLHIVLGWRPHPGTLNVFLPHPAPWDKLHHCGSVGPVRLFRASVARFDSKTRSPCALYRTDETTQPRHVLELVAPKNLRQELWLEDRTRLEIWVEEG